MRTETIIELAKQEGIELPTFDPHELEKELIAPLDCTSLDEYLHRFHLPNLVMQTKESLYRITFELFEDSAKEHVKYLEVRFAPLLHINKGLTVEEIIQAVIDGMREAEKCFQIKEILFYAACGQCRQKVLLKSSNQVKNF